MAKQDQPNRLAENFAALGEFLARYGWLTRLRPQALADPLIKLLSPYEHRKLIECQGLRLYIDPLSDLGRAILTEQVYEADVVAIFKQEIRPGHVVFDIGANEGFYSALAASLSGSGGTVIAVEPQSRLYEILTINLALNAAGRSKVYMAAIDDNSGGTVALSLTPLSNTGASSLVRPYRWSGATELADTISIDDIFDAEDIPRIDFMKIDVEGYEHEVINSMEKLFQSRSVKTIFIDYHGRILRRRGLSAQTIHNRILAAGFRPAAENRSTIEDDENGYVLYRLV